MIVFPPEDRATFSFSAPALEASEKERKRQR